MGSCPQGPARRRGGDWSAQAVCGAEAAWRSAGAGERDEDAAAVALGAERLATGAVAGRALGTAVAEAMTASSSRADASGQTRVRQRSARKGAKSSSGDGAAAEPEQERRGGHGDAQREAEPQAP